jgi:hypothetical protein
MDGADLVTVYTVQSPTEADLIRNSLKAAGIACEIGGGGQAGLAGVLSIDVLVHADDVGAARKHLRQLRREKKERRLKHKEAQEAKSAPQDVSEAIQEKPTRKEPPEAKE